MNTYPEHELRVRGIPSRLEPRFESLSGRSKHRQDVVDCGYANDDIPLAATKPVGRSLPTAESIEQKFIRLRNKWKSEMVHVSSTTRQVLHPSYQAIIGIGPVVLPFLFREVEQGVGSWFWALCAITEQDPAPDGAEGNKTAIAQAWLNWAKQKGMKW